jgi:hypothetical protein
MNGLKSQHGADGGRGAAGGFAVGCLLLAVIMLTVNVTMPLWFDRVAGQCRDVFLAWMVLHFGLLAAAVLGALPAILIGCFARRTAAGKVSLFGGLAVVCVAVGIFGWS